MPDRILINPDNRLLSYSTHDLSLYGGQTSPELRVGPAADAAAPLSAPASTGDMASLGEAQPESQPSFEPVDSAAPETVSLKSPPPSQPSTLLSDVAAWQLAAAILLQPTGSSAPLVHEAPVSAPGAGLPQPASSVSPTTSQSPPDPVDGASQAADTIPAFVSQPLELAGDAVRAVVDLAVPNPLAGTIPAFVSQPIDAAGNAVAAVVDQVATPLAEADLPGALAGIEGLPLDATTTGPLSEAALPLVEDNLEGMLGADPVGGVATLVSLVSISDVFDIGDGDVPAASIEPATGLLDALTADLPVESPLLGDVHDDDGPIGDLPHVDPLGVI